MSADGETTDYSTKPFAYDVSDLRALNRQVIRWWALVPSIAIFGFLSWFFGSVMLEEGFSWILTGVLVLIAIAGSGPWTWRPLLVHRSLRRQGLLEPITIAISPDYLVVHAARGDSRFKWSGIRAVKRIGDRVFIFSSKSIAHIIPRRAFDTEAQFENFAEAAQHLTEEAHRT